MYKFVCWYKTRKESSESPRIYLYLEPQLTCHVFILLTLLRSGTKLAASSDYYKSMQTCATGILQDTTRSITRATERLLIMAHIKPEQTGTQRKAHKGPHPFPPQNSILCKHWTMQTNFQTLDCFKYQSTIVCTTSATASRRVFMSVACLAWLGM